MDDIEQHMGVRIMTKFILFMIRIKLGLKKYEKFQFDNQKNKKNYYYISESQIHRVEVKNKLNYEDGKSNVSLNWLLNPQCRIVKVK